MKRRTRMALGAALGVMTAALVVIAFDTSYEAQTLAGGQHFRNQAILLALLFGAVLGATIGERS